MNTFLRRLEILNFLKSQNETQGTDNIVQHLINSDYLDASKSATKSQFRLIQRDLKFLLGEHNTEDEYDNDFGLSMHAGLGKSHHWKLDPYTQLNYDFEQMPAFMALALSVTQKHLLQVLPSSTQHELQRIFINAQQKLQKSQQKLSPLHYQRLTDAVEFFQRGQQLQAPDIDMNILDTIYRAILLGKQLTFSYLGSSGLKDYKVHPFGVAILLPKIYLVGKKQEDIELKNSEQDPLDTKTMRSFLVHKIENITLSNFSSKVPKNFKMKTYLAQGSMDVSLDNSDHQHHQLKLELYAKTKSNLLTDLSESPISAEQSLTQISENIWLLKAKVKRTIQLRNWLLSLGAQAKIIAPEIIQQDLLSTLISIQDRYQKD